MRNNDSNETRKKRGRVAGKELHTRSLKANRQCTGNIHAECTTKVVPPKLFVVNFRFCQERPFETGLEIVLRLIVLSFTSPKLGQYLARMVHPLILWDWCQWVCVFPKKIFITFQSKCKNTVTLHCICSD